MLIIAHKYINEEQSSVNTVYFLWISTTLLLTNRNIISENGTHSRILLTRAANDSSQAYILIT